MKKRTLVTPNSTMADEESDNGGEEVTKSPEKKVISDDPRTKTDEDPCTCEVSKMFPHRRGTCIVIKSNESISPGFYCRNETEVPILFTLSHLTPLHWVKVMPSETSYVKCGKVFFTISCEIFNPDTEPKDQEIAGQIAAITAASVFTGGIGLAVAGSIIATQSIKGGKFATRSSIFVFFFLLFIPPLLYSTELGVSKMEGVLADGRTAVVRSKVSEKGDQTLFFHSIENIPP